MVRLRDVLVATLIAIAIAGCGEASPSVERVQPERVGPGGAVMVRGRGMDRVAAVTVGGRDAAGVSAVNAALLTVVVPPDTPAGEQRIELRSTDGRRAAARVYVTVAGDAVAGIAPPSIQSPPFAGAAPSPAPPATSPRPATPTPPPTTRVGPPIAAPSLPRADERKEKDDKDDKGDDRGDGGRGRGR